MNIFRKLRQKKIENRFKRKNLNIIQNVLNDVITHILSDYINEGWELGREYEDASALIIYKKCEIRRGQSTIVFRLNDDATGSIVGPQRIIRAIAQRYALEASASPK